MNSDNNANSFCKTKLKCYHNDFPTKKLVNTVKPILRCVFLDTLVNTKISMTIHPFVSPEKNSALHSFQQGKLALIKHSEQHVWVCLQKRRAYAENCQIVDERIARETFRNIETCRISDGTLHILNCITFPSNSPANFRNTEPLVGFATLSMC